MNSQEIKNKISKDFYSFGNKNLYELFIGLLVDDVSQFHSLVRSNYGNDRLDCVSVSILIEKNKELLSGLQSDGQDIGRYLKNARTKLDIFKIFLNDHYPSRDDSGEKKMLINEIDQLLNLEKSNSQTIQSQTTNNIQNSLPINDLYSRYVVGFNDDYIPPPPPRPLPPQPQPLTSSFNGWLGGENINTFATPHSWLDNQNISYMSVPSPFLSQPSASPLISRNPQFYQPQLSSDLYYPYQQYQTIPPVSIATNSPNYNPYSSNSLTYPVPCSLIPFTNSVQNQIPQTTQIPVLSSFPSYQQFAGIPYVINIDNNSSKPSYDYRSYSSASISTLYPSLSKPFVQSAFSATNPLSSFVSVTPQTAVQVTKPSIRLVGATPSSVFVPIKSYHFGRMGLGR
jgi:hypothetical protein